MSDTSVIRTPDQNPALPRGRLVFAMDATASRAPTWAIARELQAKMFREAAPIGRLDVQLVYYRGGFGALSADDPQTGGSARAECRYSKWCQSGEQLAQLMNLIVCAAGRTQIARALEYVLRENERAAIQAVTFIGDAMEEELDVLAGLAGKLGTLGVPLFMFQEGRNPAVRSAFRLLALKSGGAYFEFNPDRPRAVEHLSEQLSAVARLAVGDTEALERITGAAALTDQRD